MWLWVLAFTLLAFTLLPILINRTKPGLRNFLKDRREALVVFAHPDDETMFFLPMISLLNGLGFPLRFLCLSTGDFDGLGETRVKEFRAVCRYLNAASCEIVHDEKLRDGPHMWEAGDVSRVVSGYLMKYPRLDTIFTFDGYGVSGHPNHISVFEGIRSLRTKKDDLLRLYLVSVPLWRKYLLVFDMLLVYIFTGAEALIAVNWQDPLKSSRVMQLYASQNVWFRKLFSIFSRYSYVNEFVRM